MEKILVTGASGYIGGRLVPRLVELGYQVRAIAREPKKLTRRNWTGVEVVKGDVFDRASLELALEGVDIAYYLIHSMTTSSSNFEERDRQAAKNFSQACAAAGVKRIIYLGALGSTGPALSKHLQSRQETGEIIRSGSVPVTELRAAIIVGSGSASFTIIYDLVRKLPVMLCPRWVQSRCEPISIRQVLAYLTGVLREPRSVGETLDIGSGEVLTYAEMMRTCAKVLGRKLFILTVPVLTPSLSSYWLNLVTRVPLSLARPLVEGLRNDVVCHDFRIREWIKVPAISYEEAVRLAVNKLKQNQVESNWTEANTASSQDLSTQNLTALTDHRELRTTAPAALVFRVIEEIGGDRGWYHADLLWRIRAGIDWLVGGVGMRRGRRDPKLLAVGDPVDFWRVENKEEGRRLVLRAEMKLPGTARLTLEVEPNSTGSLIKLRADFWPLPFWGKLYWYTVMPLHSYVFLGLLRQIAKRAEDTIQS